jgi:hypothetical protein
MRLIMIVLMGLLVFVMTSCPKPQPQDNVANDQAGMKKPNYENQQNTPPPPPATPPAGGK